MICVPENHHFFMQKFRWQWLVNKETKDILKMYGLKSHVFICDAYLSFSSVADPGGTKYKVIIITLKSLRLLFLTPPLWILYCILKKCKSPFLCKKMNYLKYWKHTSTSKNYHLRVTLFLLQMNSRRQMMTPHQWSSQLRTQLLAWSQRKPEESVKIFFKNS